MLDFKYTVSDYREACRWLHNQANKVDTHPTLMHVLDLYRLWCPDITKANADTRRVLMVNTIDLINKARREYLINQVVPS